ncbi:hypothetical protein pb186bvf_008395 [Paramecium bursaria]
MNFKKLSFTFGFEPQLKAFLQKHRLNKGSTINVKGQPLQVQQQNSKTPIKEEKQVDTLREKYLSKLKKVDVDERNFFEHTNRPQTLVLEDQKKKLARQAEVGNNIMYEEFTGEELYDKVYLPEEWQKRVVNTTNEGSAKISKAYNAFLNGPKITEEDIKQFSDFQQWKQHQKISDIGLNKLRGTEIKQYPGNLHNKMTQEEKNEYTKWFVQNHNSQLVDYVTEFAVKFQKSLKQKDRQKDIDDEEVVEEINDNQIEDAEDEENFEHDQDRQVFNVSPGPIALANISLEETIIKGDPMEDLFNYPETIFHQELEGNLVEHLPAQFPYTTHEQNLYMERWAFYRMFPFYRDLEKNLFTDEKTIYEAPESLNTYYQTLPKIARDDPGVKNVFRTLEHGCKHITLAQKEYMINFAARMSMPLQLVTLDVCDDIRKTKRMYPSTADEDRLIFDNENDVVDPALTPHELEKYAHFKEKQITGQPGDYAVPPERPTEQIDLLPVDYYINDDGFWDEYIAKKEEASLKRQPIFGEKKYLQHI